MQRVSDNVYVETAFRGCNTGFVVTEEGVVMIDTPQIPREAVSWRKEIERFGEVLFIINTEPHADHFTGNPFFHGTVIAHEGTREAILATSVDLLVERISAMDPESLPLMEGYAVVAPQITLSDRLCIHLGDRTVELIHMPGHTAYELCVFIPEEGVAFTSDNVFCKVQAWLHQALPGEWIESLGRISELGARVLVPGHGQVCDPSYLDEMKGFIEDWVQAVRDAIQRGLSLEEAKQSISFLDRYPMGQGMEHMGLQVQHWNIERLYDILTA